MLYAIVLIGSGLAIGLIILVRVSFKQRSVRRFVRGIRQRFQSAEDRGVPMVEETPVERPRRQHRVTAVELQQVRGLVRNAEKLVDQGKHEEAERLLIQALTIQPDAHDVRAQLAKLYLTAGRESKAEAMYKELLQHQDDVTFHANLGLAYYRQEKFEEACGAYEDALERDPKNPDRFSALARAYIAAKNFEKGLPMLEKASAFAPRDTEILNLLADCYLEQGNRLKAEEVYRRIHKLEPYNEEVKQKMQTISMRDDESPAEEG